MPFADEIDELMARAVRRLPAGIGDVVMTLREHFEQRGIQQSKLYFALKMLKDNMSDQQICHYAEISIAELDKLKQEQLVKENVSS